MFPNHIFNKMKQQDKDRLSRERSEHKKRKASEITTFTAPMPLVHTSKSMAEISQVTRSSEKPNARDNNPGSTIMGGDVMNVQIPVENDLMCHKLGPYVGSTLVSI